MKHIILFITFIFFSDFTLFCQETAVNDSIDNDSVTKNTAIKDTISQDSIKKVVKKKRPPKKPIYFLDENGVAIKELTFNQKCNAAVFYCKKYNKENMTIFKVYHQMYFGKLTTKEYDQMRIYLNQKSPKSIPENHNVLIHYEQVLSGFNERNEFCNLVNSKSLEENFETFNLEAKRNRDYPFESLKSFKRYVDNHKSEFHDEEKFYREVAEYADEQNNCIKKIETKFQTPVFYVVNENYNYPIKNKHFTWVVDSGAIKSAFLKKHPDANFILIKPDGEYFIKTDFLPDSVLSKLLKNKNWQPYQGDWLKSIKTNFSEGYGIVNSMTKEYEFYTSSCY